MTKRSSLLPLLAFAAACGQQVDAGYRGQPLATLHGSVVNDDPTPLPPIDVVVGWTYTLSMTGQGASADTSFVSTRVPIAGTFPTSFTAEIVTPPPAAAVGPFFSGVDGYDHEPQLAEGFIGAVPAGADYTYQTNYGIEYVDASPYQLEAHEILFVPADFPADTLTAQRFGALKAGYHLLFRKQLDTLPNTDAARVAVDSCTADFVQQGMSAADAKVECTGLASIQYVDEGFATPLTVHLKAPGSK